MKTYEGMFLLDPSSADFEAASAPVRNLLDRIDAEVIAMKPWDERRLAYEIKGRKRGLYVLTYFRADPAQIASLNHEVQISEDVLRLLVLSGDHLSEEQINADTPAVAAEARRAAAEAEREAKAADEAAKAAETSEGDQADAATDESADTDKEPAEAPTEDATAEAAPDQAEADEGEPATDEATDESEPEKPAE